MGIIHSLKLSRISPYVCRKENKCRSRSADPGRFPGAAVYSAIRSLVLRSSQMIQLVRVRAAQVAVLSRSAVNHPFASEH